MVRRSDLDDHAVEQLLRGQVPDGEDDLDALAAFVAEVRARVAGPVPEPSPALARLMAEGLPFPDAAGDAAELDGAAAAPALAGPRRGRRRRVAVLGGLGILGKVVLGASVAAAAVGGAGSAGVLPGPLQSGFSSVVGSVTPFDPPRPANLDRPAEPRSGSDAAEGEELGRDVAGEATTAAPGVEGGAVGDGAQELTESPSAQGVESPPPGPPATSPPASAPAPTGDRSRGGEPAGGTPATEVPPAVPSTTGPPEAAPVPAPPDAVGSGPG